MWILLLEQLTAAVSNCPRQHQPPTLELLFTLLREVTAVPGDAFYASYRPVSHMTLVQNDLLNEPLRVLVLQVRGSPSSPSFSCCFP